MMRTSPSIVNQIVAAGLLLAACFTVQAASGPDIPLKNLQGKEERLSDYLGKGKWVLFNIWGPKCPPCLEEVAELVTFHEEHVDTNAMVVSLALDFPSFGYAKVDQVAAFVDDYFVNFPVLLGDARLAEQVTGQRLLGTPSTLLYDPDGELAAVRVGSVTQAMIENYISNYQK
jgi:thiol-disulfide isomerase/thioredoxin